MVLTKNNWNEDTFLEKFSGLGAVVEQARQGDGLLRFIPHGVDRVGDTEPSIWVRDYASLVVADRDSNFAFVDFEYSAPFRTFGGDFADWPKERVREYLASLSVREQVSAESGMVNVRSLSLAADGGMFQFRRGNPGIFASASLADDNKELLDAYLGAGNPPSSSTDEVRRVATQLLTEGILEQDLGSKARLVAPLLGDGTGHLDAVMHVVADETVLLAEPYEAFANIQLDPDVRLPPGQDEVRDSLEDTRRELEEYFPSVLRIPVFHDNEFVVDEDINLDLRFASWKWKSYAYSICVTDDFALVPQYTSKSPNHTEKERDALTTYRSIFGRVREVQADALAEECGAGLFCIFARLPHFDANGCGKAPIL